MNLLSPCSARIAQRLRASVALGLALVLFLTTLTFTVSAAQDSSDAKNVENEHFLLYRAPDGDTVCREATAREKIELDKIVPRNLRVISHTGEAGDMATAETWTTDNDTTHLTIIVRATANLDAQPDAKAAFLRAAAAWENVVNSPVTIYLDADYGPNNFGSPFDEGVLGSTSSPSFSGVNYNLVRQSLIDGANTPEKVSIYNALPTNSVPTDLGNASTVSVSSSIARALGLLNPTAQSTDIAAHIGFNSSFSFDFDRSNGITFNQVDFEAVATHEIGHALGFTSRSGSSSQTPVPAIWDLYRFRSGTTSATFTTAQRIMTVGGPTLNSQYYFVPGTPELGLSDGGPNAVDTNNADRNQSSHWRQRIRNGGVLIGIMDPRIPDGEARTIMPNDINALSIFGYNSNTVPRPPNDDFVNAQVINGCSGTVNGTNVGATQESGEQNHSPDDRGGIHSIWYQWRAPASGSVTITTEGSNFDTVMGIYTGSAVNSLIEVDKNDDVNPGVITHSSITFSAAAGVTYWIAVDGYNNTGSVNGETGNVTLNWAHTTCGNVWSPATLTFPTTQVELKAWTFETRTSAYVKLTFSDAGFRVANWGTVTRSGNDFTVDASVERWNGVSAQVVNNTAQIYDLGVLPAGSYNFNFRNFGALVSAINFTVSSTPPAPNPIDDAREFVRWQYKDFLRREPDGPGWDHWTGEITQCSNAANRLAGETEPQCVERKRANTSAAFFLSPEFQNTGYFVLRMYRGSLARMPHFFEFTQDAGTVSQGIVVNNSLAPDVINANKQAFANQFVTRSDFRAIYDGLNNTQYVDKLFETTGVTPTASERQALIDGLNGGETRASVLFKVVDGTTTITDGQLVFNTNYGKAFYDNLFNAAFVQMEYLGYLLRDPDDGGYNFWLGKLNQFGNWVDAQMVLAFIKSPEYRSRFGQP